MAKKKEVEVVETTQDNAELLKRIEELEKENAKLKQKKLDLADYVCVKLINGAGGYNFYTSEKDILPNDKMTNVLIVRKEVLELEKNKKISNRINILSSNLLLI